LPEVSGKVKMTLNVVIICGQYLPKAEPGNDIVDPYVTLEIFGVSSDECKARTTAIRNNGNKEIWKLLWIRGVHQGQKFKKKTYLGIILCEKFIARIPEV
jgi:hypothetical protein